MEQIVPRLQYLEQKLSKAKEKSAALAAEVVEAEDAIQHHEFLQNKVNDYKDLVALQATNLWPVHAYGAGQAGLTVQQIKDILLFIHHSLLEPYSVKPSVVFRCFL